MKKFLFFITLLFCQNSFCQEYFFDRFSEFTDKNNLTINYKLVNSKDDSYFLNISQGNETTYGNLIDSKRDLIHEYEVIKIDNSYKFNYLYSKKIIKNTDKENFYFDVTEKTIDSTLNSFNIKVFENKRKKNIKCYIEFEVEKSNDLFNKNLLKYLSHKRILNYDFTINNGTLKYFKIVFINGFEFELKLKKIQQINTTLFISKEQIIYK